MTTLYYISTGRSRLEQDWQRKLVSWKQLTERLADCRRTEETFQEYKAMSRMDKGKAKDVGGFVGGTFTGPQRKACDVEGRSLVTLDIDYADAGTVDKVREEFSIDGTAWCLYSTHSHSPEKPRYRLIIPLKRMVTPDEYIPVARKLAEQIGMDLFDDSTYQPERLMYWPSASKDAEFVFEKQDGVAADPDWILDNEYTDWRNVTEWPVSSRTQKLTTGKGGKQEDPTQKPGIIGVFCRTYSISEAISAFLSDVYSPCDQPGRYTFIGGSTEAGAVVYEDKWLYSHHGTDPCCEKEVNAFDLVRIHRFGNLDLEKDPETPVIRLPSFARMEDLAGNDPNVRKRRSAENIAAAEKDFGAMAPETSEDAGKDTKEWALALDWRQRKGKPDQLENTPRNYRLVLENDPAFKGAVAMDEFSHNRILLRDIPGHKVSEGKFWTDADDRNLMMFFADPPYYAQGKQNIIDAANYTASHNTFHPVRDYLQSLTWDGVPRLDTLVIDYLGAQDCELNRALTRKHFCAAVRRVFEPGCKHDGVLAFDGRQGIGKSTLIKTMGGEWFSDTSISVDKANETGMQLQGTWLLELAELTDYKRSSVDAYKNFISSQEDKVRVPYDRSYQTFPRQCVIFASTNDRNFLKGNDGNRRFWIIPVGELAPSKSVWDDLPGERDQIWAEAFAKYRTETSELGALEQKLYERQEGHNEMADDIRIDKIRAFMSDKVPQNWDKFSAAERKEWREKRRHKDLEVPEEFLVPRPPVCYQEIAEECLNIRLDAYTKRNIRALLEYVGVEDAGRSRDVVNGLQRRFKLRCDKFCDEAVTEDEIL